jgi:uncharacterized membrane protein YccC
MTMTSPHLLRLGLIALIVRNILQLVVDRNGWGSDLTDFLLGALLGVSAALLLLVAWRKGRGEQKDCSLR